MYRPPPWHLSDSISRCFPLLQSVSECPPADDLDAVLSVCPGFNTGSTDYDEWGCV